MTLNYEDIAVWASEFCHRHIPALFENTGAFTLIGTYLAASVAMYFFTRGKEFIWAGYAGMLFFLPFIKI